MKLTHRDISKILEDYNIGDLISERKADEGVVNHNWIIKTTRGKFVLRVVSKGRKLSELLFEQAFLAGMKSVGFPYKIPMSIEAKSGKTLNKVKGQYFWVYEFIRGSTPVKMTAKRIREVARMMAISHKMAARLKLGHTRKWPDSLSPKPKYSYMNTGNITIYLLRN